MKYHKFIIENYRAIKGPLEIDLSRGIIPLVGVNECGKTTILQAIFCFDHINDEFNECRHLKNILNLYETVNKGNFKITAVAEIQNKSILKCFEKLELYFQNRNSGDDLISIMSNFTKIKSKINPSRGTTLVDITREIKTTSGGKHESFYYSNLLQFLDLEVNAHDEFCKDLLLRCPYILYNDDFNDRPKSEIVMNQENDIDWENIYKRIFSSTDTHKESYDLINVFDEDENRRETILNVTSNYLTTIFTKTWKKVTAKNADIKIRFLMPNNKTNEKILKIKIEEMKNDIGHSFDLADRSKGFIWYYNFIMKILFNPKQVGKNKSTIFLLDEPGSYLHEAAQNELCKNLSEISKKEGVVIYCTHAPQLLNPEIIPANAIKIVDKNNGNITAVNITQYQTDGKKTTTLQPVYEALKIPEYKTIKDNEKLICVEGIYDKYAIHLFCDLTDNCKVMPSTNTDSIVTNISYFITYNIAYCAIWDNDVPGRKDKEKAEKYFGNHESYKFGLLPNKDKKNRMVMEEMFDKESFDNISNLLQIETKEIYSKDDFQNLMQMMYYNTNIDKKKKMGNCLSQYSKIQFTQLTSLINQLLKTI